MSDRSPQAGSGQRSRPPRALLAWEFGAGHTHLANLLGVARHLRDAGIECLATLNDLRGASRFADLGIPVVQNHIWPHGRRWTTHARERRHVGFLDVLGNLGFADPDWVAATMAHYDGLFRLFEPDIVLAENAYGAQLAARGRCPAVAFGFGEYLPAIRGGAFAFPETEPTSWSAAEVLAGLNRGLALVGREPLGRLEQMFDVADVFPFGPAAFDGNAPFRERPNLPAYVPGFEPRLPAERGDEVFIYLQGTATSTPAVPTFRASSRACRPSGATRSSSISRAPPPAPLRSPTPSSSSGAPP